MKFLPPRIRNIFHKAWSKFYTFLQEFFKKFPCLKSNSFFSFDLHYYFDIHLVFHVFILFFSLKKFWAFSAIFRAIQFFMSFPRKLTSFVEGRNCFVCFPFWQIWLNVQWIGIIKHDKPFHQVHSLFFWRVQIAWCYFFILLIKLYQLLLWLTKPPSEASLIKFDFWLCVTRKFHYVNGWEKLLCAQNTENNNLIHHFTNNKNKMSFSAFSTRAAARSLQKF